MLDEALQVIAEDLERTESILASAVTGDGSLPSAAEHQVLGAGGKRLRPALLLLAARGRGKVAPGAHKLAAAMEMIHAASLVHDDVVDGSPVRRGRPTVNASLNDRVSVLVGDYLLAAAFWLIADHGDPRIIERLAGVMYGMTTAELEQLSSRFNLSLTEEQYLSRIERKTAALIAGCCEVGGLISGEAEYAGALFRFGRSLGIAFQITDDLLDIDGDPSLTGKPVGTDLAGGTITLPVVRALTTTNGNGLRQMLSDGPLTGSSLRRAIEALRDTDAIQYCRFRAAEYCNQARQELSAVTDITTRTALHGICDFVLDRRY